MTVGCTLSMLVTNQAMFNYFRYKSGLKSRTFRIYTDDQQMINERSYGMQSVCSLQMLSIDESISVDRRRIGCYATIGTHRPHSTVEEYQ